MPRLIMTTKVCHLGCTVVSGLVALYGHGLIEVQVELKVVHCMYLAMHCSNNGFVTLLSQFLHAAAFTTNQHVESSTWLARS